MKKIKYVSIIILLAFVLLSCESGDMMKYNLSDSNCNITELLTIQYTDEQLSIIGALNSNLEELNCAYPLQCLRQKGKLLYSVYKSQGSILLMAFDLNGSKQFSNVFPIEKSKNDYNVITAGQTLSEVRDFDARADYSFLFTGRSDVPRTSYHYTLDGYVIEISYNRENQVISITSSLI